MKKKFLLTMLLTVLAAVSVLVVSCRKETPDVLDLDMASITMMTPAQRAVFDEAVQRLDKHISFDADAGQYVMSKGVTAVGTGLSERFFNFFKRNFEATNTQLLQQKAEGYIAVEVSRNRVQVVDPEGGFDVPPVKAINELEMGGVTKVETTWWGYVAFLSNSDLRNISSAAELTTILCGPLSGLAAPFTIPVGTITAITSWITNGAADKNPNGVIVNIPQFGAPSYVPQSALPK